MQWALRVTDGSWPSPLGAEESQQSWSELLEQLQDRGLGGVELVIADEHAGLAAAVRRFPARGTPSEVYGPSAA